MQMDDDEIGSIEVSNSNSSQLYVIYHLSQRAEPRAKDTALVFTTV